MSYGGYRSRTYRPVEVDLAEALESLLQIKEDISTILTWFAVYSNEGLHEQLLTDRWILTGTIINVKHAMRTLEKALKLEPSPPRSL